MTDEKILTCKKALEHNHFDVYLAKDTADARNVFFEKILPGLPVRTVSTGGSMTLASTGILDEIARRKDIEYIVTGGPALSPEQKAENRRRALTADLFLTGTNALTADGRLVNLDGIGNRVAAIAFGPLHVVLFIGKNKICDTLEQAWDRVKNYAAPMNVVKRFSDKKTVCAATGKCGDCNVSDRICNVWAITEKSAPAGRIKVVLIEESLGY